MEDYEPGDILGKGSFGSARVAVRKADKKKVVLKQIYVNAHKELLAAMKEIRILGSLDHPNVVKQYDSFQGDRMINIAMEYADGGDLGLFIKKKRAAKETIDIMLVRSFATQMLVALKYIHARKILHRDLKPANIFLTHNNLVKLGDFGVSTILMATQNLAQTFCGTIHYLPPEVCEEKPYNNKADVWAVGCVIYEMLAMKRAFDANSVLKLGMKICKEKPEPLPPNAPSELVELVTAMLTKVATLRPNASKALHHDALAGHMQHLPLELKQTERYKLTFSEEQLFGAPPPPTKEEEDLEKAKAEMEAWARKDALRLEAEDQNAFDVLLESAAIKPRAGTSSPTAGMPRYNTAPNVSVPARTAVGPSTSSYHNEHPSPQSVSTATAPGSAAFSTRRGVAFDRPLRAMPSEEDFHDSVCVFTPAEPSTPLVPFYPD
eukprot:TRINITY_DN18863_c0_g1_i1.p1 TRINITY_DN18863_c0_g1~~TRINITY_DN18863_c0_g1_i1.p1  ORF type:complete len:458 (+),score=164.00 TRINITY_DN18863_c0_g1_i1:72-1376(+)